MSTTRRHESLIPLSREHHYALMLCLRINRGLPTHGKDSKWLQSKAQQVSLFLESDLATHFIAEEKILFPSMQGTPLAASLIAELVAEHRELERLVSRLRDQDTTATAATLKEFATSLEAHIRKEERLLFPIYEREIARSVAERVEHDLFALIGNALQPKHPELLDP